VAVTVKAPRAGVAAGVADRPDARVVRGDGVAVGLLAMPETLASGEAEGLLVTDGAVVGLVVALRLAPGDGVGLGVVDTVAASATVCNTR
jgi:hypothetical protein